MKSSTPKWMVPLCLMVGTTFLLMVAYQVVMTTRERMAVEIERQTVSLVPFTKSKFVPAFELSNVPGLAWTADQDAALDWARQQNALVFLEIDGVTDANGAVNHVHVFSDFQVRRQLSRYVRVLLYVDAVPGNAYKHRPTFVERMADAHENLRFQSERFDTVQTPFYAILKPGAAGDFEMVDVFEEGVIRNPATFAAFLKKHAGD